jgi:predicted nucleic acid-binding protein
MIILDTNVLSALVNAADVAAPIAWLDRQPRSSVWTTCITIFELRFGVLRLAPGRRRDVLMAAVTAIVEHALGNRVLPLDAVAAEAAAQLMATRDAMGRTVDIRDTLIAGIALARRATLATRNLRHFADLDVPVVDPWSA